MKKNMKKIRYVIGVVALLSLAQLSCTKKEFAKLNTDPDILGSAPPPALFLSATLYTQNSFEYFYDLNRFLFPVAQIFTNSGHRVSGNTLTEGNSLQYRYNDFFVASTTNGAGNYLTDAERQFDTLAADVRAARASWVPIFRILKAYYAFYVSDAYGSIAYTQAFKAKEGLLRPAYDPQQALFDTLDAQLKSAVTALKAANASTSQVLMGSYDLYYGDKADVILKWARAANSLRLKIAMRLMKRDPTKMASIANEVLSDDVGVMASNDDSWIFQPNNTYTGGSGGNWDPLGTGGAKGIKGTVDFMWNNSDPRIHLFYKTNNYTQANINTAIAAGKLGAGTTQPARRYVGSYASQGPADSRLDVTTKVNDDLTLDTLSTIQDRLINPSNKDSLGNNGTGRVSFILISYADVCFMRAELAARGVTSESAQTWYEAGITASINMYNDIASLAKVAHWGYKAVAPSEITSYLTSTDVQYNAAKALEQITTQAYINFFLQPNEAWALYKRTGYPNTTTALVYETFMLNGTVAPYPRRATINYPSEADDNYANKKAAIDAMAADPDFGVPADNTGRVWWDKK
jgi:hypothetical protein